MTVKRVRHAAHVLQPAFDLAEHVVGALERIPLGQHDGHFELALVVAWNKVYADVTEDDRRDAASKPTVASDHGPAVAQRPGQDPTVSAVDDPPDDSFALLAAGAFELEKPRAEHRRQVKEMNKLIRIEKADRHAEAAEEPADPARP